MAKPSPAYEEIAHQPLIDIKRLWEVNCEDCGVLDNVNTKAEARKIARRHATLHRDATEQ